MFLLRKQQLHPVALKLPVAILLSFLASSPEPTAAAILRVVADPVSVSSVGIGYGGLSQADGLGLALGTGGGESVKGGSVLFAWELPASSPGDRSQAPLSLESLLTSLSQLRVDGNGKQKGATPQVPIFNQVDLANIYEGVYIFTPKTPAKTDSPAKSADTQDKSTPAPTTNPSSLPSVVSLPQTAGLPTFSLPGDGYSLPRTSASAPLSVVSLPQTAGLSVPSLPGGGYSIPIDPQKELSSMPTDGNGKLNDFLKVLGQFGALSIDVNLPLKPKAAIANALNLKTDYSLPSNLQGGGMAKTLAAASQIQQQVQQQVEKNSQQYQQQQAQIQQQIQRQMQEEQRRQAQFQREQQRRFQEQERQLRQQYQQQQQEIERQMQQQIQQQIQQQQQRLR